MAPASAFLAFLTLSLISNVYSAPAGSFSHATILERAAAVKAEYDYVIVGGGTAGLTVGDRLTEDGKCLASLDSISSSPFHTSLLGTLLILQRRYRTRH